MKSVYVTVLLVSFLAVTPAPVRAGGVKDPVTYLGRTVLTRTDLVARGKAESMSRIAGSTVVRFRVSEILFGRDERDMILLLSPDPGLFPRTGAPTLLFLGRLGPGRYRPVQQLPLVGREAPSKVDTLKSYLQIEQMTKGAEKRAALHDLLLANLESEDGFKQASAVRELAHFTASDPELFSPEEALRIADAADVETDPVRRELLDASAKNLAHRQPPPGEGPEEGEGPVARPAGMDLTVPAEFRRLRAAWSAVPEDPEERIAILASLCARHLKHAGPILIEALRDEDARVREIAGLNAGEGLVFAAGEPLLTLLAREREPAVLRAVIQSLGILGVEDSLPALIKLSEVPELRSPVVYAAARIGTDEARAWLAALADAHGGAGEEDRLLRELVEFVDSERFKEQEKALAEIRRRRLR